LISVELLLIMPAVTALLCFVARKWKLAPIISAIGSAATVAAAVPLCADAFAGNAVRYGLWHIDGLSALFVILTTIVGLMVSLYSGGYLRKERDEETITTKDEGFYFTLFHMLVSTMVLVFVVDSIGLLWIGIEATTLVTAFLVGFYKNEGATEATWKYLMICSVGITLALVGIVLVYVSSQIIMGDSPNSLDWTTLMSVAQDLDPDLIKVAFVFILIGFGTKMGLVPMHTWLPDAHGQAPTPISAMLSAALLNCALYSIMRFQAIVDITVPGYTTLLLIGFGLASMTVAAAFILISRSLKRMLAYSSIEHMGLIAIGLGVGTPLAVFGALFHVVAHSLTKSAAFFSAGNVIHGYGTMVMKDIRGMREKMPRTSFMFAASTLALVGLPPFAIFIGELSIIRGIADAGMYPLAIAVIILLTAAFAGILRHVMPMLSGTTDSGAKEPRGLTRVVPTMVLIGAAIFLGLFMPESFREALESIVTILTGGIV
jgi:hydrogenase-4 component F